MKWVWVRGHEGVKGNEWVDREAVATYQEKTPVLVKWNLSDFPEPAIFLENPQQEKSSSVKTRSSKSNSSGKVFYVSYVEGELQRHSSWSECEKRVKGQSGAKFKKLKTEEELVALLRSWKVSAF